MKQQTPPSSCLFDLVIDFNWDGVILHASQHPRDALYQSGDWGETPLYVACQFQPPLRAIVALLQANRDATLPQTKNQDTPLHIACRLNASQAVINALVHAKPSSVLQLSRWGQSPLSALCEGFKSDSREVQCAKMDILLKAAQYGTLSVEKATKGARAQPWRPLHTALRLGSKICNKTVIEFLIRHYPHHCCETNEEGMFPLHIAVSLPYTMSYHSSIIKLLIDHYPQAAAIPLCNDNGSGDYPLHVALANKMKWVAVQYIFDAAPFVVDKMKRNTQFHPFVMAALNNDLDGTFGMLLSKPDVIHNIISINRQRQHSTFVVTDCSYMRPEKVQKQHLMKSIILSVLFVGSAGNLLLAIERSACQSN